MLKRKTNLMGLIANFLFSDDKFPKSPIMSSGFGKITGYNMNYNNILKTKIKNKRRKSKK